MEIRCCLDIRQMALKTPGDRARKSRGQGRYELGGLYGAQWGSTSLKRKHFDIDLVSCHAQEFTYVWRAKWGGRQADALVRERPPGRATVRHWQSFMLDRKLGRVRDSRECKLVFESFRLR